MRSWTKEEEAYLQDFWGVKSLESIERKLDRTINSVRSKGQKLGLGPQISQCECITLNQLVNALGYSGSYSWWVTKYIKNGLPVSYRKDLSKISRMVDIEDFWDWAEKHQSIVNFAHFEKNSLGVEPNWVDAKRRRDQTNPSRASHNRCWTKKDDALLTAKLKLFKYSYTELAREFNRTEGAIKRRIHDLKIPYRPIGRNNHVKWTEEENEKMMELYYQGYDSYHIAKELNKTELSISDRIKAIIQNDKK